MTQRERAFDRLLAHLARRQHGVFARWQLPPGQAITDALARRIAAGRLIVLHRGVYAFGHDHLTLRGRFMAAVLAHGPTAVVSHVSAAKLWDLLASDQRLVDITVPGTSRLRRRGIRVHRARELHPEEITELDGLPVTTVTRTICDIAAVRAERQVRRAINQADHHGRLSLDALQVAIDRHPTRRGTRILRRVLSSYEPAPLTRSELERRFLELMRRANLAAPLCNHRVEGYEVDVYWPAWGLVIELDGRGFHSDPVAFEADPVRDARLQRAGLRVLRVTWRRLLGDPDSVIADILALAALHPSTH
ncbi:MAG TPA: DUF559 domain-containing protein [Solirubrobacteraceae bacterium]|nr:DUF559 domain-containing protein [Solirubrobacteraceae bacterium]